MAPPSPLPWGQGAPRHSQSVHFFSQDKAPPPGRKRPTKRPGAERSHPLPPPGGNHQQPQTKLTSRNATAGEGVKRKYIAGGAPTAERPHPPPADPPAPFPKIGARMVGPGNTPLLMPTKDCWPDQKNHCQPCRPMQSPQNHLWGKGEPNPGWPSPGQVHGMASRVRRRKGAAGPLQLQSSSFTWIIL